MKLLKVVASNYRNCESNISIDFLPSSKKMSFDKTYELNEIDKNLYLFSTNVIIGKNASGKTSVLKLLENVYRILESFQLDDEQIYYSEYYKSRKNILDKNNFKLLEKELPDDMSKLFYILKERVNYVYFYDDTLGSEDTYHTIYQMYVSRILSIQYWEILLKLFDNSILELQEMKNDIFCLKYENKSLELST